MNEKITSIIVLYLTIMLIFFTTVITFLSENVQCISNIK